MKPKKNQFIQQHIQPKRQYSQNFLVNEGAITTILKAIGTLKKGTLIECGVGKGALTLPLAKKYPKIALLGVEIDSRCLMHTEGLLAKSLPKEKASHVRLLEADLCGEKFFHELAAQKDPLIFVGNLPYHIASQVLLRVIQFWPRTHKVVFMFQKEFAERLRASPSDPAFGKLSVLFQSYYEIKKVASLDPESFYPRPSVSSEVLTFVPLKKPAIKFEYITLLSKFLGMAFMHRRKTLRYNLKLVLGPRHLDVVKDVLSKEGITLDHRAEIVPVPTWGAISEALIN